jgi:MFS family permease
MPDDMGPGTESQDAAWLGAGVISVGAASFFSDPGHEIAKSVLPSFLTSVLHAPAGALGLIEGLADALTGIVKLIGGPLANEALRNRLASSNYLGTALATGAIGLAGTVWQAGVLRALAWLSRDLRSPARDAMLASLAPRRAYGRPFGLERAGDNLGAVVGPLLAAGLVAWVGIRHAICFSAIPGFLAAVAITIAARQALRQKSAARRRLAFDLRTPAAQWPLEASAPSRVLRSRQHRNDTTHPARDRAPSLRCPPARRSRLARHSQRSCWRAQVSALRRRRSPRSWRRLCQIRCTAAASACSEACSPLAILRPARWSGYST